MVRRLLCVAGVLVMAGAVACSQSSPNPASPSSAVAAGAGAAPDGTTLKAPAPSVVSPVNDEKLKNRRPTFVFNNVQGKYVGSTFSYRLEMYDANNALVSALSLPQGSGTSTTYAYTVDLEKGARYTWKVRAQKDALFGPWSPSGSFITIKEPRTDDPPPGGKLPLPRASAEAIISAVAAERPDYLRNSCQDHGGSWQFLDTVVDRLREVDTRWGYNWKRGNVGDPSMDVIDYHWSGGADEGSIDVYIIDIIGGHCGPTPYVTWNDVTAVTYNAGGIGRWTGRGRF
jgi:hypothetical protein